MPKQGPRPDLQIAENMAFQRRMWVAERVGWGVVAAIMAAAALGLFGHGPLSSAVARAEGGGLRVEYPRFWRQQSPMTVRLTVQPRSSGDARARIWLDRSYLEAMNISRVTPLPETVEAGPDRLVYVFALTHPGSPFRVTFQLEAERPWVVPARVGLEGGPEVRFSHFIYP